MLLVRMLQDGYVATNDSGQDLFDSGANHERLFHFLETDTEPITKSLKKYFDSVIDPSSLDVLESKPNLAALKKAKKDLESLHPFFRYNDYFAIVSEMLAFHLNYALLLPPRNDTKVSLEWYGERLKPLVEKLLIDSRYLQGHEGDKRFLIQRPNKALIYEAFEQKFYNIYVAVLKSGKKEILGIHGILYPKYLQEQLKHQVYWLIDASARYFSKLTLDQRASLYRRIFPRKYGLADLKVLKHTSFSNPHRAKMSPQLRSLNAQMEALEAVQNDTLDQFVQDLEDKKSKEAYDKEAREILAELKDNSVLLDQDLLGDLNQLIEEVISENEPAFYEEYEVHTLYQLLFLELEQLIKNGTIVKRCRQCNRYFITTNKNVEYCDNIAEGETLPCSEIGSTRAFLKKLDEDPALKYYNRSYKTHYARKVNGLMTPEQFDVWRDDAKAKLEAVRSGDLDLGEYERWLKL